MEEESKLSAEELARKRFEESLEDAEEGDQPTEAEEA